MEKTDLDIHSICSPKDRLEQGHIPVMLTIKATAENFGIAQHHARQLALSGKVKAVRAGKKILINQDSVAEYFNSNYLSSSQDSDGNSSILLVK